MMDNEGFPTKHDDTRYAYLMMLLVIVMLLFGSAYMWAVVR